MASNSGEKVIVNVEVVDNFVKMKQNLDFWKTALKDAQVTVGTTKEEIAGLKTELEIANNAFDKAKKEMEDAVKSGEKFDKMTHSATASLSEMQKELSLLKNLSLDNLSPEQVQNVNKAIEDLTAKIEYCKNSIKTFNLGDVLTGTIDTLDVVSNGVSLLDTALTAYGVDTGGVFASIQQKAQEVTAILQTLGVVTEYVEKQKYKLITTNLKNIATMVADRTASLASSAAMLILGKSADATSTSFKLLRGAIIGTGIGALVVLVGVLINQWDNLVGWFKKATSGLGGFGNVIDSVTEMAMGVYEVIKNYVLMPFNAVAKVLKGDFDGALEEIKNGFDVVGNYQKGANEQRVKNQEDAAEKIRIAESKAKSEALLSEAEKLSKKLEVDKAMGKSAEDLYTQEMEILDKKIQGYKVGLDAIADKNSEEFQEAQKLLNDVAQEKAVKGAEEKKRLADEAKERQRRAQQAREEEFQELSKRNDTATKASLAQLKQEADYYSDSLEKKQAHELKMFNVQRDAAIERLNLQKSYKKLTEEEYAAELATLEAEQKEFLIGQKRDANQMLVDNANAIHGLIGEALDLQLSEIEYKYKEAFDNLADLQLPVYTPGTDLDAFQKEYERVEALLLQRSKTEVALNEAMEQEKADTRKAYDEKRAQDIEKRITDEHANELAQFADNELEKMRVQEQTLLDIVDKKREAGLQTFAEEAAIRALQSQQSQLQLDLDLAQNDLSAKKKYELKKAALEAEALLYADNPVKMAEINQALLDLDKEYLEAKIEQFQGYADNTMEALGGLNDLMGAMDQAKLQKSEENNNKEKAELKKKLDKGLISEKEYNEKVAALDKKLAKEKAAIARKQAIREKAMAIFEIGINTASAIVKALPSIPLAALAASMGAIQLATVLATPLPSEESEGGDAGASSGSGQLSRSTGQAISSEPVLSDFEGSEESVPFAAPLSDGGYSVRSSSGGRMEMEEFKEAVTEAVGSLHVVATIEDIRREDSNYVEIQDRSKY